MGSLFVELLDEYFLQKQSLDASFARITKSDHRRWMGKIDIDKRRHKLVDERLLRHSRKRRLLAEGWSNSRQLELELDRLRRQDYLHGGAIAAPRDPQEQKPEQRRLFVSEFIKAETQKLSVADLLKQCQFVPVLCLVTTRILRGWAKTLNSAIESSGRHKPLYELQRGRPRKNT